jgi:hypothetical protein
MVKSSNGHPDVRQPYRRVERRSARIGNASVSFRSPELTKRASPCRALDHDDYPRMEGHRALADAAATLRREAGTVVRT